MRTAVMNWVDSTCTSCEFKFFAFFSVCWVSWPIADMLCDGSVTIRSFGFVSCLILSIRVVSQTLTATGTLQMSWMEMNYMIWSNRYSADVFCLSLKEKNLKFLFLIVKKCNCKVCHFNISLPWYASTIGSWEKNYKKSIKYAQKMRPFLCNFNVCSYLIHRTFQKRKFVIVYILPDISL